MPLDTEFDRAAEDADGAIGTSIDDQRARRREAPEEQLSSLSGADRRSSADRASRRRADESEAEPDPTSAPKSESDEDAEADPFEAIADLAGGRERFKALTEFGVANFRDTQTKTRLAAAAQRTQAADRDLKSKLAAMQPSAALKSETASIPAKRAPALSLTGDFVSRRASMAPEDMTVFHPSTHLLDDLAFLGKEAEQTLGPAIPKPTRRSPRASAHLPYATREDHAADVIRANAVSRKGADDTPLRRAIDQRVATTAEWRRGEGALQLGRLTEREEPRQNSFVDEQAYQVAEADTGVQHDGASVDADTKPFRRQPAFNQTALALAKPGSLALPALAADLVINRDDSLLMQTPQSREAAARREAAIKARLAEEARKAPGFSQQVDAQRDAYAGVLAEIDGVSPGFPRNLYRRIVGVSAPAEMVSWMKREGLFKEREGRSEAESALVSARSLSDEDRRRFYAAQAVDKAVAEARAQLDFMQKGAGSRGMAKGVGDLVVEAADGAATMAGALLDPNQLAQLPTGGDADAHQGDVLGVETHAWMSGRTPEEIIAGREAVSQGLRDAGAYIRTAEADEMAWDAVDAVEAAGSGAKERAGAYWRRGPADRLLFDRYAAEEISRDELIAGIEELARADGRDGADALSLGLGGVLAARGAARAGAALANRLPDGPGGPDDWGGLAPAGGGVPGRVEAPDYNKPLPPGAVAMPIGKTEPHQFPLYRASKEAKERIAELRKGEADADFKQRVGAVPSKVDEFDAWADTLSGSDVWRIWQSDKAEWTRIGWKIRGGKRYHEWFMPTMLEDLRDLDIPMREIRDLDFRSPTGELRLRDPDTGRVVTHREGTDAIDVDARRISDKFHEELAWSIRRAAIEGDRRALDQLMKVLAKKWLPNGVEDLPAALKARIKALK